MTETRYPLPVQLLVAGPAVIGGLFIIAAIRFFVALPAASLLLAAVGLIAIFVTIFQLPVALTVSPGTVAVEYLFGFKQKYERRFLRARVIGFSPGTLLIQATDKSWRSRLIGSFKVNLAFVSNSSELLREFEISAEE